MTLENLIHPDLVLQSDKNQLRLIEPQNTENHQLREVIISNFDDAYFCISLDKHIAISEHYQSFSVKNLFLNPDNTFINKKCDAIILTARSGTMDCYYLELKSKNATPKNYERQLVNSYLFVNYLSSIFNTHYPSEAPIQIQNHYFVLFKRPSRNQESKVRDRDFKHDTMRNFKFSVLKWEFKKHSYNFLPWTDIVSALTNV